MKYQFKIECLNVSKFLLLTIHFCMPSLLKRRNLDQVTEFEKPGRVAAKATISVGDILESNQCISVIDAHKSVGAVSVFCSFQLEQEINLLDWKGRKKWSLIKMKCSIPVVALVHVLILILAPCKLSFRQNDLKIKPGYIIL